MTDTPLPPESGPEAVPDGNSTRVVWFVAWGAVIAVAVVVAVLLIGSLGGTDRGDAGGLEDDVTAFVTVLLSSGEPDRAYAQLAQSCTGHVNIAGFRDAVEEGRVALADELGVDLGRLAVAEVRTRDVEDGEGEAQVILEEIGEDGIPLGDPFEATGWSSWIYQDGTWRALECSHPADLMPV